MATIPQIRNRLLEGFPEPQADLLAHVFVESQDQLVTKAELNELTGAVKELAVAQGRTEQRVEELAVAQGRTEQRVEELAVAQGRTEQRVEELAVAQGSTEQSLKALAESHSQTQQELRGLTKTVHELVTEQKKMLIRLDKSDGRSFELLLRTHLPSYLGRHMRKCRVIAVEQILDSVEGRLTDEEVDDLLRIDILATAEVDGKLMYLVGEVSCTAHKQDVVRALRRAEHLRKAGLPTIAFVACEAITHKTAELASRENVRLLVKGRLLPETA
jgi:chromosome segregation ATPase